MGYFYNKFLESAVQTSDDIDNDVSDDIEDLLNPMDEMYTDLTDINEIFNSAMKSVGINELYAYKNGTTVIYEASISNTIKKIKEKIKETFDKIIKSSDDIVKKDKKNKDKSKEENSYKPNKSIDLYDIKLMDEGINIIINDLKNALVIDINKEIPKKKTKAITSDILDKTIQAKNINYALDNIYDKYLNKISYNTENYEAILATINKYGFVIPQVKEYNSIAEKIKKYYNDLFDEIEKIQDEDKKVSILNDVYIHYNIDYVLATACKYILKMKSETVEKLLKELKD